MSQTRPSCALGGQVADRLVSLGLAIALVGTQMTWTAFLGWVLLHSVIPREVEISPQPAANLPGAIELLADPATAPRNLEPEPTTSATQFPSTAPTGSVETAVHSDTGHSDTREPPEVRPKNGAKGTTAVPTGIGSAALPLGAHATKRHKASTSRQYAEARRRIRRPASMYYGLLRGSYYSSFDRGYSYGGPAPHSDAGG
jgi:hypothetical protein